MKEGSNQSGGPTTLLSTARADAFVKRLVDAYPKRLAELSWCLDERLPKPEGFEPPPEWVQNCIKRFLDGPLSYLRDIVARKKTFTLAERGKIAGLLTGLTVLLTSPSETTKAEEAEVPQLAELRESMAVAGAKYASQYFLPKKPSRRQVTTKNGLNARQLAQYQFGFNEGISRVVTGDGQARFDKGDTATIEICYAIWWFWPEIRFLENVHELHTWLSDLTHRRFSEKTTEKVCADIGLKLAERGRPAGKILPGLEQE